MKVVENGGESMPEIKCDIEILACMRVAEDSLAIDEEVSSILSKFNQKSFQNRPKIDPRSTQNRSQIGSGTKLRPAKAAPGPSRSQVDAQIGSGTDFLVFFFPFFFNLVS